MEVPYGVVEKSGGFFQLGTWNVSEPLPPTYYVARIEHLSAADVHEVTEPAMPLSPQVYRLAQVAERTSSKTRFLDVYVLQSREA